MIDLQAQRSGFMNSGWQNPAVDSLRPRSSFSIPLDGNWRDSAYSVEIEYPELIEIDESVLKRWKMEPSEIPSWPVIDTFLGVSHGKATLDASFVPLISREGRLYAIESFKYVIGADRVASRAPLRTSSEINAF